MKKQLYSLMLNDDIVREVDRLAHLNGTNRSNYVNRILAEYVNMTTPERRVNDIFEAVGRLLEPMPELVPFFNPNASTLSLKSALVYKYRPTVRYEVELHRGDSPVLGTLSVIFRTQSQTLIADMTRFFRLWKAIEDSYLEEKPVYALYDGRLTRELPAPKRECTTQELAESIASYIGLFDRCLKGSISGQMSDADVEKAWLARFRK